MLQYCFGGGQRDEEKGLRKSRQQIYIWAENLWQWQNCAGTHIPEIHYGNGS